MISWTCDSDLIFCMSPPRILYSILNDVVCDIDIDGSGDVLWRKEGRW